MKLENIFYDYGNYVAKLTLCAENQNDKKFIEAIEHYLAGNSTELLKILQSPPMPRSSAEDEDEAVKVAEDSPSGRGEEVPDKVQTCEDCKHLDVYYTAIDDETEKEECCTKGHEDGLGYHSECPDFEPKSGGVVTLNEEGFDG